jgi:hypothetical protein
MFAIDCGWNVGRAGLELASCEQETWDILKRNLRFVLDDLPVSYQEKIANITKLLFGESRRHIIPVGKSFTVEDVKAQQPDTEDFLDVKNLAPGMFAAPPQDAPPKSAAGDSARSFRFCLRHCRNSGGYIEVEAKSSTCNSSTRCHRSHFEPVPAAGNCALFGGSCHGLRQGALDGRPSSGVPVHYGD